MKVDSTKIAVPPAVTFLSLVYSFSRIGLIMEDFTIQYHKYLVTQGFPIRFTKCKINMYCLLKSVLLRPFNSVSADPILPTNKEIETKEYFFLNIIIKFNYYVR